IGEFCTSEAGVGCIEKPLFEPAIQAILDDAVKDEEIVRSACHAATEKQARLDRLNNAWLRYANFLGDRIPRELTGKELEHSWALLIVDVGSVLKADGWESELNAVCPGAPAKEFALAVLRKAMDGDVVAVERMMQEAMQSFRVLGFSVDCWLRKGLREEI